MVVERVDFNSSIIGKEKMFSMLHKSSKNSFKPVVPAPQNNVDTEAASPANHKIRNYSIGIGSAAALVILGIAGRKGKLGKPIQRFLGGAAKDFNIAEFNAKLDRSIPELSDDLKFFNAAKYSQYSDISKLKTCELKPVKDGYIQFNTLPNNETQIAVLNKDKQYTAYYINDANNKTLYIGTFDASGDLNCLATPDNNMMISFGKYKLVKVIKNIFRKIDPNNSIIYDSYGTPKYFISLTDGIEKNISYAKNAEGNIYPQFIIYKNKDTQLNIKTETLAEDKSILLEEYYDKKGKVIKSVNNIKSKE